ncbi:MAG: transcriptional repressor [candidate division Zixibacteria bacterium]|nr:transcriptional repressor [candidate division Zixibacteria bacterium]
MKTPMKKRITKQREVILEEIRKLKTHPTADEIYMIVREKLPKISLGTVYRNLDILSDMEEIRKMNIGGQWRYDYHFGDHHHVHCIKCNRIDDIYGLKEIEIDKARGITDFEILDYKLEFQGICPSCKEKEDKRLQI